MFFGLLRGNDDSKKTLFFTFCDDFCFFAIVFDTVVALRYFEIFFINSPISTYALSFDVLKSFS